MKLKYICGTFILVFFLSGCDLISPIDSIKPQYLLNEEEYVTDTKSAELALNGIYQMYRADGISVFRVNMWLLSGAFKAPSGASGAEGFDRNAIQVDNTAIQGLYTSLYAIVNASNYLIEALEYGQAVGIDSVRSAEIIGECRFHRAFAHFMLLRQFGQFYNNDSPYGIVLRREPYRPENPIAARDNVADCYAFILEDLDAAATAVSKIKPRLKGVEVSCRAWRQTVLAVKAKVLFYKQDYSAASAVAKQAIAMSHELDMVPIGQYEWIFLHHYKNREVLFAPYTLSGTEEIMQLGFHETVASPYSVSLAKSFGRQDPRFIFEAEIGMNNKYPRLDFESDGEPANGYIYLRLAELYLIRAEAEFRKGKMYYPVARLLLQKITGRAGYPASLVDGIPDEGLLEAIRQHKWLELMGENGEEWFDLVRYTAAGNLEPGAVQPSLLEEWQFIAPIPQKVLSGNKRLVQNPKY